MLFTTASGIGIGSRCDVQRCNTPHLAHHPALLSDENISQKSWIDAFREERNSSLNHPHCRISGARGDTSCADKISRLFVWFSISRAARPAVIQLERQRPPPLLSQSLSSVKLRPSVHILVSCRVSNPPNREFREIAENSNSPGKKKREFAGHSRRKPVVFQM